MDRKTEAAVAALERMTITQLVEKYAEVFGEHTRSRQRLHLIRRIAWRLQSLAEGDLTERARKRAMELARDTDVRQTPPRAAKTAAEPIRIVKVPVRIDPRLPAPASQLVRKGPARPHCESCRLNSDANRLHQPPMRSREVGEMPQPSGPCPKSMARTMFSCCSPATLRASQRNASCARFVSTKRALGTLIATGRSNTRSSAR
jgi:hypothetical protein